MTSRAEFCCQLRGRLLANGDKIVLRVLAGPDFDQPHEFTGKEILEEAEKLVSAVHLPDERGVVLILLPHKRTNSREAILRSMVS